LFITHFLYFLELFDADFGGGGGGLTIFGTEPSPVLVLPP